MHAFLETINEWQYLLGENVRGLLATGSVFALFSVFVSGVLTSLTPCVYPMIPVTITYMGSAAAGNRRRAVSLSVVYVLGLAMVYTTLGVIAALAGKQFGSSTQQWYVYAPVGLLIIVFGLSMLDVFTIPIPGFAGKAQSEGVRRGGFVGAFLMGVAAGFVAAPCTAPVLFVILQFIAEQSALDSSVGVLAGVAWGGTLTLVFSLGLGLLLMVLGIFSGLLTNLPRPGRWMDFLKKAFGVGLILVGGWFLFRAFQTF